MRKGGIFSVVGLVLGAVSAAVSITAIVFSAIGLVPVSYTHLDVYKRQR